MTDLEFKPWPKIARLNRDITISEKLDGTNAAIVVQEGGFETPVPTWLATVQLSDGFYKIGAQSRNRIITPESDNYGFAGWVYRNAEVLTATLGEGYHYGEWWGQGIQRRYGMDHKRFSLFNTARYVPMIEGADAGAAAWEAGLDTVPEMYVGPYSEEAIQNELEYLRTKGSLAAPGFMNPEGIVVYHQAARQMFKVTLVDDEAPKSQIERSAA